MKLNSKIILVNRIEIISNFLKIKKMKTNNSDTKNKNRSQSS